MVSTKPVTARHDDDVGRRKKCGSSRLCCSRKERAIIFLFILLMLHHLTNNRSIRALLTSKPQLDGLDERSSSPLKQHSVEAVISSPRPEFDCAINSIRVPKTASTTVFKVFTKPLLDSKVFQSTNLVLNTCLMPPGGCSFYWNNNETATTLNNDVHPYFGIGPRTDRKNIENTTNNLGRCFPPFQEKIYCFEFDQGTNTMKFGPPSKTHWFVKNNFEWNEIEQTYYKVYEKNETFFITPIIQGHVGLDTSLFGWLLPPNPMVFVLFRDPVERLLSSFHYGIPVGADRPGQVKLCQHNVKKWQEKVAETRKLATLTNDTTAYETLLRQYLEYCPQATQNAYTAFLDPLTKNLQVALNHLESHVIVGMYNDVQGSLERWMNITLDVCGGHPKYSKMKRTLTHSFNQNGGKTTRVIAKVKDSVVLSSPDISQFDKDIQNLIRAYTKEDEVIFERARELYEEQWQWGLARPYYKEQK